MCVGLFLSLGEGMIALVFGAVKGRLAAGSCRNQDSQDLGIFEIGKEAGRSGMDGGAVPAHAGIRPRIGGTGQALRGNDGGGGLGSWRRGEMGVRVVQGRARVGPATTPGWVPAPVSSTRTCFRGNDGRLRLGLVCAGHWAGSVVCWPPPSSRGGRFANRPYVWRWCRAGLRAARCGLGRSLVLFPALAEN